MASTGPVGTSAAAAVVFAALYFLLACASVANLIKTKFKLYAIIIAACIFRVVGSSARAAYLLGEWHPSLSAIYLAFSNAGYGINIAALCLITAFWCKGTRTYFPPLERKMYGKLFVLLVPVVICFGPILGVVAAIYTYGIHTQHGAQTGQDMRTAATWGLFSVICLYWLLILRISLAALVGGAPAAVTPLSSEKGSNAAAGAKDIEAGVVKQPFRNPKLIAFLCVCASLLLLRGIVGVMSLYSSYSYLVREEKYWYPLFEVPQLMCMAILAIPTLVARIALVYPGTVAQDGVADADAAPSERDALRAT